MNSGGGGAAAGGSGGGTTTTDTAMGGGGAGPAVADHLLISEVVVAPEGGELIEIWNPTAAAIDLTDVYLSDNSTYVDIASGGAWAPITNNPGTDFLARFPAGTMLNPDQVLVIGTVGAAGNYETNYMACPTFYLSTAAVPCGGGTTPAMLSTETGSITAMSNLSNMREMLVLFTWSGDTADTLKDLDYVTWGATFEAGTRVDKTGVAGYQPDTAPDLQKGATAPSPTQSIERCSLETGEKTSGGNGITGHDETSEDLAASFKSTATPSPGKKNDCL